MLVPQRSEVTEQLSGSVLLLLRDMGSLSLHRPLPIEPSHTSLLSLSKAKRSIYLLIFPNMQPMVWSVHEHRAGGGGETPHALQADLLHP